MSVTIVAIDTCTESCSVGIIKPNGECFESSAVIPREHNLRVLPMLETLLETCQVEKSDIDAIAVSRGPGAFTGVRIGISVAQGIALALDKPVIPVSTLSAMAWGAYRELGCERIVSCIDARMNEVYWAPFYIQQGKLVRLADEQVASPSKLTLPSLVPSCSEMKAGWCGVGTGFGYDEQFSLVFRESFQDLRIKYFPQAKDILSLAKLDWEAGKYCDPSELVPTYLRNKVVN